MIWFIWLQSLNMKYGWDVGGYACVPPHALGNCDYVFYKGR